MTAPGSHAKIETIVHELQKELRLVHLQLAKSCRFRQVDSLSSSVTSATTRSSKRLDTVHNDSESEPRSSHGNNNDDASEKSDSSTCRSTSSSLAAPMPSVSEINCYDCVIKEGSPQQQSYMSETAATSACVTESFCHTRPVDTAIAGAGTAYPVAISPPPKTAPAAAVVHHDTLTLRTQLTPSATPTSSPPLPRKEGVLLHLIKRQRAFRLSHSMHWVAHYFIVDEHGVRWFSVDGLGQGPRDAMLGEMPFWQETTNSRGTHFKRAAVCWPQLLLWEDCPQATDATKSYFGLEHVTRNGTRHMISLAAHTPHERDAWVRFLQYYIELYLPPRVESQPLCYLVRTDVRPLHCSTILHGEAPGA